MTACAHAVANGAHAIRRAGPQAHVRTRTTLRVCYLLLYVYTICKATYICVVCGADAHVLTIVTVVPGASVLT